MDNQNEPKLFMDGVVEFINPVSKPDSSKDFKVRTFGIDCTRTNNGMPYENHVGFQATKDAVIGALDRVNLGDRVRVHFYLSGQLRTKDGMPATEKNPGSNLIYTNTTAWRVEMLERAAGTSTETKPTEQSNTAAPDQQASGQQPSDDDDLPF